MLATPAPGSLDALRRFPAADVIIDHALSWLESIGKRPFFLWLHLMDPHAPYYPKEKALQLMGCDPITPFRARYLNSYWNRSDLGPKKLGGHRDYIVALYDAGIRWVTSRWPAWLQRSARPSAGLIASWLLPPIMEKSFSTTEDAFTLHRG